MNTLYSFILKHIIFRIADKVMNTNIIGYYNDIKKMKHWDRASIEKWQSVKLQELILHAYNTTPFYKRKFDELGLVPSDIKSINDLNKVPVLTREDALKYNNELISNEVNKYPHKKSSTGGTTGESLNYLLDNRSWSFSNAHGIYSWERTDYKFGDRYVALGSSSLFVDKPKSLKHRIFYKLKNKIGLSGINMSDKVCAEYVDYIKIKNIKYIYGYASAIFLLAQYIEREGIKVSIKACFPTSEVLHDNYREVIIRAFKCDLVNCYGAHDGGITGYEFEKGAFEIGYGSIVRVKGDSKNEGPALITDLFNYAMPFINYELGDEVKLNNKFSNYNGQIMEEVKGRTSEIIELSNGSVMTGRGFHNIFATVPVLAYHFDKKDDNTFKCQIVKDITFEKEHDDIIIKAIERQVGKDVKVVIEYVEDFELSKSGKRKQIIV